MFEINLSTKPKFVKPEYLHFIPVPPALHSVTPRSLMPKAEWDKLRRKTYDMNNDCCWTCGVHRSEAKYHQWLEAHELYDVDYRRGRMKLRVIVALCHSCHNYIHRGRLAMLVNAGKCSPQKYDDIIAHGQRIMEEKRPKPWFNKKKLGKQMSKSKVKWSKWYLEFRGKKYYSPFKDELDYLRYYTIEEGS